MLEQRMAAEARKMEEEGTPKASSSSSADGTSREGTEESSEGKNGEEVEEEAEEEEEDSSTTATAPPTDSAFVTPRAAAAGARTATKPTGVTPKYQLAMTSFRSPMTGGSSNSSSPANGDTDDEDMIDLTKESRTNVSVPEAHAGNPSTFFELF